MAGNRKAELLDLAAAMISERGYHAVGMDDIGQAAGISGPALYKHFRSKQHLIGEILIGPTERLDRGARSVVKSAESPAAALHALVDWHTEFTSTGVNVVRIYYGCLGEMAEDDRERLERRLDDYIELWVSQIRGVRPDIRRARARWAVMAVFGLFSNRPDEERASRQHDEMLNVMAKAALQAVLDEPARSKRAAS